MRKVVLEGSILSKQVASGISNYAANLFHFIKLNEHVHGIDTKIVLSPTYLSNFFSPKISGNPNNIKLQHSLVSTFQTFFGGNLKCDLFHSPYMFLPPKAASRSNLLTVHDLINFERPVGMRNELRKAMLKLAISRSSFFICISKATREKFLEHFPQVPEEKIRIIYQGIDEIFLTDSKEVEDSIQRQFKNPYMLYIGQRSGYKNFNSLLEFLKVSNCANNLQLVCVGGGSFSKQEQKRIVDYQLSAVVKHAGFVSNEKLKVLLNNAYCLVYTSLHEGFGIPILEAMSCKCPVVCGNFSSMKEISGDYSILVDKFTPEQLESALEKVSALPSDKILEAQRYSRNFRWQDTAKNTLQFYSEILLT